MANDYSFIDVSAYECFLSDMRAGVERYRAIAREHLSPDTPAEAKAIEMHNRVAEIYEAAIQIFGNGARAEYERDERPESVTQACCSAAEMVEHDENCETRRAESEAGR